MCLLTDTKKTVRTDVENPDKYQCAICDKKRLTKEEFSVHLKKHLETDKSKKKDETNCQILESENTLYFGILHCML